MNRRRHPTGPALLAHHSDHAHAYSLRMGGCRKSPLAPGGHGEGTSLQVTDYRTIEKPKLPPRISCRLDKAKRVDIPRAYIRRS
jgi:hypothetical protein